MFCVKISLGTPVEHSRIAYIIHASFGETRLQRIEVHGISIVRNSPILYAMFPTMKHESYADDLLFARMFHQRGTGRESQFRNSADFLTRFTEFISDADSQVDIEKMSVVPNTRCKAYHMSKMD